MLQVLLVTTLPKPWNQPISEHFWFKDLLWTSVCSFTLSGHLGHFSELAPNEALDVSNNNKYCVFIYYMSGTATGFLYINPSI